MDDKLVETAVTAMSGALVKVAAERSLSAGGKVWGWFKTKLGGGEAETAKAIEAAPEKPSVPDKIRGLLKDLLAEDAEAGPALRRLLEVEGLIPSTQQNAHADHGGKIAQVAGDGNKVQIS